jgi:hypothetical protein
MMVIKLKHVESCFNVNFNILLKQLYCASVVKLRLVSIKIHGTNVKNRKYPTCFGGSILRDFDSSVFENF